MKQDQYGRCWITTDEVASKLYLDPSLDYSRYNYHELDEGLEKYNHALETLFIDMPPLVLTKELDITVEEFDRQQQSKWHMPQHYQQLDIASLVLDSCDGDAELQRCGEELLLFQERDAFDLLRYLKYLVDTLRSNNVVWGVGRGSSVSSFVLYKLGVHRINSLAYDLDPREFLK